MTPSRGNGSRQGAILTIGVLSTILAWLILDQMGGPNPIRDVFSRLLSPVQLVVQRASVPLIHLSDELKKLTTLRSENEALQRDNAALRNQLILMEEARIENETLRRQLEFKSAVPTYHLLSAEVIGYDPSNLLQYLIIDRGANDGIERGMPVLAAEGLAGRIREVSADSSKVMLITDPSSSVSSLIQRSRAAGVVQGHVGPELLARYIPPGDSILPGDIVLTSGVGGNFPKRLIIGQVSSVQYKDVDMYQEATIIPAVKLRDLETVMVLLNFTPIEFDQLDAEE